MRFYTLIFGALLATSCASPPGKFKESDFIWEEKTIPENYQKVYRSLKNGFRTCAEPITWTIDSDIYHDEKRGEFHASRNNMLGTPQIFFGSIHIKSVKDDSTLIRAGVTHFHENSIWGNQGAPERAKWLSWAEGGNDCG